VNAPIPLIVPLGMPLERRCVDCGDGILTLQVTPLGWHGDYVYLCSSHPNCRGLLSANPDGTPQGFQADAATALGFEMAATSYQTQGG
jgi:hypothetical protein